MPKPRPLGERELYLITVYSHWEFSMTPRQFNTKWAVKYEQIALICSRSDSTVSRWFSRGRNYRPPTPTDMRHLALMDFLLEHFEEIPERLVNLLRLGH
ncbi:MAG: hypothetical protein Fur006_43340 [Coleofasciculaceae cyanobacterium]